MKRLILLTVVLFAFLGASLASAWGQPCTDEAFGHHFLKLQSARVIAAWLLEHGEVER